MKLSIFTMSVALLAIGAPMASAAPTDLVSPTGSAPQSEPSRNAFYCQPADYSMIYNISSGFGAEIADDIPVEWEGYDLEAVTLWMGEWFSVGGPPWQDPVGVRLNLYHESCPPEMEPTITTEIAWNDLEKTLVYSSGGITIYEVIIPLSPPVTMGAGMSLGATALIDWGQEEPFAGICATPWYVSYGACVAHLDATWWGYDRWTPIDYYTTIAQDLGYCLHGSLASAPVLSESATSSLTASPNPTLQQTTLRYQLANEGWVQLRVFDAAGRCVRTLQDGVQSSGAHHLNWNTTDELDRALPTGVYLIRLDTPGQHATVRLLRLE